MVGSANQEKSQENNGQIDKKEFSGVEKHYESNCYFGLARTSICLPNGLKGKAR